MINGSTSVGGNGKDILLITIAPNVELSPDKLPIDDSRNVHGVGHDVLLDQGIAGFALRMNVRMGERVGR